jgi:hypothetical protein
MSIRTATSAAAGMSVRITIMLATIMPVAIASVMIAGFARPATAADAAREYEHHGEDWYATRAAIAEREELIAMLESDPAVDDGYRAPLIARARAEINALRAALGAPQWRSISPCCYSRKLLYIR